MSYCSRPSFASSDVTIMILLPNELCTTVVEGVSVNYHKFTTNENALLVDGIVATLSIPYSMYSMTFIYYRDQRIIHGRL